MSSNTGYVAGGIRYFVEWASQLIPGNWSTDSADLEVFSVVPNADGTETVVVRREITINGVGASPDFLRIKVEQVP